MSQPTAARTAVLSQDSLATLKEYLAFRHLFRGASIALMRWEKLYPLVRKVDRLYHQVSGEIRAFAQFIRDAESN